MKKCPSSTVWDNWLGLYSWSFESSNLCLVLRRDSFPSEIVTKRVYLITLVTWTDAVWHDISSSLLHHPWLKSNMMWCNVTQFYVTSPNITYLLLHRSTSHHQSYIPQQHHRVKRCVMTWCNVTQCDMTQHNLPTLTYISSSELHPTTTSSPTEMLLSLPSTCFQSEPIWSGFLYVPSR